MSSLLFFCGFNMNYRINMLICEYVNMLICEYVYFMLFTAVPSAKRVMTRPLALLPTF